MPNVRTYSLDTNVILSDAESIFKFQEHNVVIPLTVIEEADNFKRDKSELGRNARAFSRYIDTLRAKGSLISGVQIDEKLGKLFVVPFDQTVANCLPYQDMSIADNRILATVRHTKTNNAIGQSDEVILVSKDTNLRIKADIFGITAEDYKHDKIQSDELYTGRADLHVKNDLIDKIYAQGKLDYLDAFTEHSGTTIYPNQCFTFKNIDNPKQSALARYNAVFKEFRLLPQDAKTVDILPKNSEQQFALDMLKDPEISLVSMSGLAGCGKTLLALAAGLYGILETQRYNKILLLKPIVPMDNGHELGFLPGSMEEKLAPWMASYSDNIEVIMAGYMKEDTSTKKTSKKTQAISEEKRAGKLNPTLELISHGLLEFGSLEHIRGRSLPNQFIVIDECQNLSSNAIKTIITRIGEGSKIVLMGDITQIDSPYLDSQNNGLTILVEAFKNEQIAGHITMRKSERSKLAEIASNIL